MAYAKSLDCHSPVPSWRQSTPQKVQSWVSQLVLFVEKTRIHWLNFLSLKSEVNFTFNSGAAQARNDLAFMPSFTLQKLIPFKDTMEKCKLLLALQYFWEGKKKDWRFYFNSCNTFSVNNPNICVPKTLEQVSGPPGKGWTGKEKTALVSVSLYMPSCFQKVYLLSCIWMHGVRPGPNHT